ncbi:MAG: hypothetical protein IJ875_02500 [Solobacterium sp.]|nr:hypothetical protein [Solobacterium sp.]
MFQKRVVVAMVGAVAALAYIGITHTIAAIQYMQDQSETKDKEKEKEENKE